METNKPKQTCSKQRKHMFDLAIQVDIFVQTSLLTHTHTHTEKKTCFLDMYMFKNRDDALDPSFFELNYLG